MSLTVVLLLTSEPSASNYVYVTLLAETLLSSNKRAGIELSLLPGMAYARFLYPFNFLELTSWFLPDAL